MRYDAAVLLQMFARCANMLAGRMIHVVCMDGVSHKIGCVLCGMRTVSKHFHVCHNC